MAETTAKPQLKTEAQSAIHTVEQYLRQGEPLLAYNAVQEGLQVLPENVRLWQLKGLAVARSGDVEQANQLLCQLAAEDIADAETFGMLARTHKDLALRTSNSAGRASSVALASSSRSRKIGVRRLGTAPRPVVVPISCVGGR